ncbi:MAG: hypothetical protein HWE35_04150 [Rhodobacteraceae bacterium]|nr:hypothetical protein [Paracoccaceae bacterium]
MLISYELSKGGVVPPISRSPDRVGLIQGVHAAVDPGRGRVTARKGGVIGLQFSGISAEAEWMEIGIQLGSKRWLGSTRIFVQMRVTGTPETSARVALRVQMRDGFQDFFAAEPVQLSAAPAWAGAELFPPAWAAQAGTRLDVHLFLPPRDTEVEIHDFAATASGA